MDDPAIRTAKAGEIASIVAAIPAVRTALRSFQRRFAASPPSLDDGQAAQGAVLDGRDIGTVILPDADVKFFVDADLAIRAQRRFDELTAAGERTDLKTVHTALAARDDRDRNRSTSPLIPAADAIMVDTSHLGVDAMVDFACDHLPK